MKKVFYSPLKIDLYIYTNPREFCESDYKPFGHIPEEWWEKSDVEVEGGTCTAFSVKESKKEIHVYLTNETSIFELMPLIGHELGHFKSKVIVYCDDEDKANMFEDFVEHTMKISKIIETTI